MTSKTIVWEVRVPPAGIDFLSDMQLSAAGCCWVLLGAAGCCWVLLGMLVGDSPDYLAADMAVVPDLGLPDSSVRYQRQILKLKLLRQEEAPSSDFYA
jgi:hypothetical protein